MQNYATKVYLVYRIKKTAHLGGLSLLVHIHISKFYNACCAADDDDEKYFVKSDKLAPVLASILAMLFVEGQRG